MSQQEFNQWITGVLTISFLAPFVFFGIIFWKRAIKQILRKF